MGGRGSSPSRKKRGSCDFPAAYGRRSRPWSRPFGDRAGRLVARVVDAAFVAKPRGRRSAAVDGFSLHANTRVAGMARDDLEKLCRYIARPAVCEASLERLDGDRVLVHLKTQWNDGSRALILEPQEVIARLVPLIPRPGMNLLRYHGQFAARGKWRNDIVPLPPASEPHHHGQVRLTPSARRPRRKNHTWAELLHRAFAFDVLTCKLCGGRRKVLATFDPGPIATRILVHLGLPTDRPTFAPARGPPSLLAVDAHVELDSQASIEDVWFATDP